MTADVDENAQGTCPECTRPIRRAHRRGDRRGRPTGDWTCNVCCAAWVDHPPAAPTARVTP